jgi:hypothetical protein
MRRVGRWLDATFARRYVRGVAQRYLYQVINNTRQEILFGVTDLQLEKELERLSKDPKGPTAGWKHNDEVTFRSLTDPLDDALLKYMHKNLESRTPPNKFKVLKTFGA